MSIPWLRAASSTRNGNLPFPVINPCLFNDATIGCLDEFQDHVDFRRDTLLPDRFDGLRCVQLRLQQQPESRFDTCQLLCSESLTLKPDDIHAVRLRLALADCLRIRQNILCNNRVSTDVTMLPHAAELMDAGIRADCRMIVD